LGESAFGALRAHGATIPIASRHSTILSPCFLLVALATSGCAGIRNAPPTEGRVPPDVSIASFASPSLDTILSAPTDGERELSATSTPLIRLTSNRIALGLMKEREEGGQIVHPMAAMAMDADVVDAAILEDMVCALRSRMEQGTGMAVRCAKLSGDAQRESFDVAPDAERLLLLSKDERCVLRRAGEWECYTREFNHPWKKSEFASSGLNRAGLGQAPVPDSRCFLTRDRKLYCLNQELDSVHEELDDVLTASVGLGAGDFSGGCAVRQDGTVSCWTEGLNETGVLGGGERGPHDGPTKVLHVAKAIAVSREPDHACALTEGHDVWCWGSADGYSFGEAAYGEATVFAVCESGQSPGGSNCINAGPFGSPHRRLVLAPRLVPELHGVLSIATGYERTCGVQTSGRLICLGGGHPGAWSSDLETKAASR
jgi:hypothetical protein